MWQATAPWEDEGLLHVAHGGRATAWMCSEPDSQLKVAYSVAVCAQYVSYHDMAGTHTWRRKASEATDWVHPAWCPPRKWRLGPRHTGSEHGRTRDKMPPVSHRDGSGLLSSQVCGTCDSPSRLTPSKPEKRHRPSQRLNESTAIHDLHQLTGNGTNLLSGDLQIQHLHLTAL